jgi:ferric-dicitrate binding protein FerR (iron transport regulator)
MSEQDYTNYDLTDFLTDEDFRNWIREGHLSANTNDYVAQVLAACPQKAALLEDAIAVARRLTDFPLIDDAVARRTSWQGITARIAATEAPGIRKKDFRWMPALAAASLLLLVMAGGIYRYQQQGMTAQQTRYAETRQLQLPDQSEVLLGAHSTLTYNKQWNDDQPREVWLKGDAAFHVKHLHHNNTPVKDRHRFLVHMEDSVTIEVLGTVFMVRQQHHKTAVALESGAVKVWIAGKAQPLLHPGEIIAITHGHIIQRSPQGAQQATTAFRQQHLIMQQMPVSEILQALEDNYGKKIMVEDTSLLQRQVDGTLPLYDQQQALQALAMILDIQIHQRNDTLWLVPAP